MICKKQKYKSTGGIHSITGGSADPVRHGGGHGCTAAQGRRECCEEDRKLEAGTVVADGQLNGDENSRELTRRVRAIGTTLIYRRAPWRRTRDTRGTSKCLNAD